jgi:CTP synthase (UTP-ammonia lyase)
MLLHIGILGDFNPTRRSHLATNDALRHAADALRLSVSANWLPTDSLTGGAARELLSAQEAIFAGPGSPYLSTEGMLAGIEFARLHGIPFLGTCGGFQYALIEYARHVLGLADANTAENGDAPAAIVITPVACPVPDRGADAPKLSGRCRVTPAPGSLMARIYNATAYAEEYFCNFEVNPKYVAAFQRAGLAPAARGERGELRAVEIRAHPFFLATLFQPQLSSREGNPHPLIAAFLRAACDYRAAATGSTMTAVP